MNFLETFWSIVVFFLFLSYLIMLFQIVVDLFRDSEVKGWEKAVWMFFLIILPVLTALIYLIVRGGGMANRSNAIASAARQDAADYVRHVAGSSNPAEQISSAKSLLDQGVITPEEFQQLKVKALA